MGLTRSAPMSTLACAIFTERHEASATISVYDRPGYLTCDGEGLELLERFTIR